MSVAIIVEDNIQNLMGLKEMVPWAQFGIDEVLTADNGLDGLHLIEKRQPAVALVDVEMPVMDGLEMSQRVRSQGLDTRIVFISSYDKMEYVRSAMKLGAMDYIFKPIQMQELLEALHRVLTHYQGHKKQKEKVEMTFSTLRHAIRESSPPQDLMQRLASLERSIDAMNGPPTSDQTETAKESTRQMEIARHIQSAIDARYAQVSSIEQLLDGLYISQSYANHVFKRVTGVPIYSALQQRRIQRAQQLLLSSRLRIHEIAFEVGYSTPSHFTKLFKQYTGQTPGQFAKQK